MRSMDVRVQRFVRPWSEVERAGQTLSRERCWAIASRCSPLLVERDAYGVDGVCWIQSAFRIRAMSLSTRPISPECGSPLSRPERTTRGSKPMTSPWISSPCYRTSTGA